MDDQGSSNKQFEFYINTIHEKTGSCIRHFKARFNVTVKGSRGVYVKLYFPKHDYPHASAYIFLRMLVLPPPAGQRNRVRLPLEV